MDFFKQQQNDAQSVNKEQVQKQQQEFHLLGKTRRIAGLTLFSYNKETGDVKVAATEKSIEIDYKTKKPVEKAKVVVEKNCIYGQALNKKNFIRHLVRRGIIKE